MPKPLGVECCRYLPSPSLFFVFLPWQKYILVCFLSFFHGRSAPRRGFGINLCDIYVDSNRGRLFFDVGNEVEDVVEEVAGCF